jgi:UDP-N-acetyl-2-amino-2-deoxyglucuronate dehydrogenase
MKQIIRFGLIGAGVASETHARELACVEGASLEAVFARDEQKAAAFSAAFSIPRHYSDISEFLADPAIDAVIITTPNGLHLDYAVAAAEARKHVVVEKPLEITEDRAKRIIAACRSAGTGLFIIYQRRHSNAARQAMLDIQSGKLGRIVLVNIIDNQYRNPGYYQKDAWRGTKAIEGGGCVMTQSTHLIDLAQYLVGPIRSVFARTDTVYHDIETEDVAAAVFEFAGGALGTFSSSTAAYPGQRHLLTISGTAGSIIINGEHDQIVFRHTKDDATSAAIPADFSFADPTNPRDYPTDGQRAQLRAIVGTLLRGTAPESSDEDLLMAARVTDAIYKSSAESRLIEVR